MARVNFEDDVEAQDEFWKLLQFLGGDRDRALGKLVRFFRVAQKAYGHNKPMLESELREKGFEDMIESGWANPVDGGFHALGAAKHFAWYRARCVGGQERASKNRDESGRFKSPAPDQQESSKSPAADQQNPVLHQPLSLSLSPSPSLSLANNTNTEKKFNSESVKNCIFDWKKTLEHFEIDREITVRDEVQIAAAAQRFGAEWVSLAFAGARKQQKSKTWDPAQFVSLRSYLDPSRIERLVNIGSGKEGSAEIDWTLVFNQKAGS